MLDEGPLIIGPPQREVGGGETYPLFEALAEKLRRDRDGAGA